MAGSIERKLTTILAADAEGFSREMGRDEVGTVEALRRAKDVFFRLIEHRGGRVANTAGDGLIAEFPSVVEAVTSAIEIQRELTDQASGLKFRIGLHLGDVIVDGQDLLGDGVNLAARLQEMAEPGGILLSQQVFDQVSSKLTVGFEFLGDERPHNFPGDIPIYRVAGKGNRLRVAPERARAQPPRASDKDIRFPVEMPRVLSALGIGWVFLFVVDLASGPDWFSHWALIPILALAGFLVAPKIAKTRWQSVLIRGGVTCLALLLINLFSWSGTFWAIYPIAAFGLMFAFRLLRAP